MSVAVERRHGPSCACVRCTGTPPGNQLSRKHGGYSMVGLSDRASAIADEIRPTLPAYACADEPTLLLLATTFGRIERANAALDQVDGMSGSPVSQYVVEDATNLARLREDLRGWINLARRLANDLGLTPTSRAKLGLNLASTRRTMSVIEFYEAREHAGLPLFGDDEDDDA